MTINEYQKLAMTTLNPELDKNGYGVKSEKLAQNIKIAMTPINYKGEGTHEQAYVLNTKGKLMAVVEDGKEVVLYRNEQEFVEKVKYYLEHEDERLQIANAGYERVMRDGHEVCDRVKQVMLVYEKICEEKR